MRVSSRKKSEEAMEAVAFELESKLQTYVMKRLREIEGGHFFKIADRYTSGISDILGVYDGRFIAIELKVKDNKPTALQTAFLTIIDKCGGAAGVAYNWGEVKQIIRRAGVPI